MTHAAGVHHPQYRHGMSDTPEFMAYMDMIRRCYNPNRAAYAAYGGRGIMVCARWLESFDNFIADIGPRPSPDHSLDRRDNSGDYTPDNARWATSMEQCNNRRSNRIVCYHGQKMTLAQAVRASKGKITRTIAKYRLARGWEADAAFDTPPIRRP